jgi:MFS family permease
MSFMAIREPPGATEGGGNALVEALKSLRLVVDDRVFRQYLVSRILMLSIALAIPFYVILMQQQLQGRLSVLGWLIIASGLASSLSAPLVGKWADHNSRQLMVYAALLAGVVGIATWTISSYHADWLSTSGCVIVFFLVTLCHSSVRLGRKVYLVDMANTDNRAQYVAVSNTLVGIAMLLGGIIGVIADLLNVQAVILLLSVIALVASVYTRRLANVSG